MRAEHPDAWFVAEVIHGDYPAFVQESTVDSVTQYELWKAIWSSINDANLWELAWSLTRHDEFLDTFVPHDVRRQPRHHAHREQDRGPAPPGPRGRRPVHGGRHPVGLRGRRAGVHRASRRSARGATTPSGRSSRPTVPGDDENAVLRLHQDLIGLRRRHPWLHRARTTQVELTNTTFVYEVRDGDDALLVALNLGDEPLALPGGEVLATDDDTRGRSDVAPHGWAVVAP